MTKNINLHEDIHLSSEEYNKYAKHIILEQFGIEGQQKLKKAKILLVGAGGLGCPCITYLSASGVGNIGIIDHDFITISNLQRQILYTGKDINKLKTEIAKQKIHEINPLCTVKIYSYQLNEKNAFHIIRNYDIIIDTSDNFTTRYIISETCYKLHKTHIYGAIQNFEGHISVFNYKSGPSYSDLYPKHLNLENNSCNDLGVLGVLPGIIGILQATEAIKIITGLGLILSGCILIYNAQNMSFKKIKLLSFKKTYGHYNYTKDSNYAICSSDLNSQNNNHFTFIDVRQNIEFQHTHIQNAINIPLKEIIHKNNINLLTQYLKNKTIIVYCSNNSRAIIASNILKKYKIKHLRLKNGLDGWINKKKPIKINELYS